MLPIHGYLRIFAFNLLIWMTTCTYLNRKLDNTILNIPNYLPVVITRSLPLCPILLESLLYSCSFSVFQRSLHFLWHWYPILQFPGLPLSASLLQAQNFYPYQQPRNFYLKRYVSCPWQDKTIPCTHHRHTVPLLLQILGRCPN